MSNKYPKHDAISEIAESILKALLPYNEEELREIRDIAMQLSPTNCPFSEYWVKDVVVFFIDKRLDDIKYSIPVNKMI